MNYCPNRIDTCSISLCSTEGGSGNSLLSSTDVRTFSKYWDDHFPMFSQSKELWTNFAPSCCCLLCHTDWQPEFWWKTNPGARDKQEGREPQAKNCSTGANKYNNSIIMQSFVNHCAQLAAWYTSHASKCAAYFCPLWVFSWFLQPI